MDSLLKSAEIRLKDSKKLLKKLLTNSSEKPKFLRPQIGPHPNYSSDSMVVKMTTLPICINEQVDCAPGA